MLKQQPASALLTRSRITFSPSPPSSPIIVASKANLSTAEPSIRAQHPAPNDPPPRSRPAPPAPPNGRMATQRAAGRPPMFTLGYKEAAYQWWCSVTPPVAEHNVLSYMPFIREATTNLASSSTGSTQDLSQTTTSDPYGTRIWRRSMVQLSGKDRALNEVSIERVGEETEETLVMVHGYGAGLGFFYKNFEPISRIPGLKLYALDMLGMGNSTRPPFKIQAKTREEKVKEAEDWFIDALEEWRKVRKIERFTLLGHSLGGYLAVSYAIKYPGHLKKLILASPVGIPEDPFAVNASMPEPEESTLANEFTQDQQSITEPGKVSKAPNAAAAVGAEKADPNAPKRPLPSWLVWLWDANVSPFSIVRMAGPLGPRFVSGWSSRRFNHLPPEEAQALHDYSFSIFKQKGSGEYALAYILAPGAYARRPAINRIQEVGRQALPKAKGEEAASPTVAKETGFPIIFMYGENDWMDVAGGLAAEEKLKLHKAKVLETATEDERRLENGSSKVVIIPKAGHHLYLDNPKEFNDIIRRELIKTREEKRSLSQA